MRRHVAVSALWRELAEHGRNVRSSDQTLPPSVEELVLEVRFRDVNEAPLEISKLVRLLPQRRLTRRRTLRSARMMAVSAALSPALPHSWVFWDAKDFFLRPPTMLRKAPRKEAAHVKAT